MPCRRWAGSTQMFRDAALRAAAHAVVAEHGGGGAGAGRRHTGASADAVGGVGARRLGEEGVGARLGDGARRRAPRALR